MGLLEQNNLSVDILKKDSAMTLVERSKESTDLQVPSQNLEYSRSMNQIEPEETPLGDIPEHRRSQGSSRQLNGSQPSITAIEKTPQFNGSSPVILEQPGEDRSTLENAEPSQPNYESDTGALPATEMASATRFTLDEDRHAVGSSGEVIQAEETQVSGGYFAPLEGLPDGVVVERTMKILPGSEGYDPNVCTSDSRESTINDVEPRQTIRSTGSRGLVIRVEDSNWVQEPLAEEVKRAGSPRAGAASQNRYKNPGATTSADEYYQRRSKESNMRGEASRASRYSKGHQDELDKVAERINRTVLLNSQSNCGDSLPTFQGQVPSERDLAVRASRDSSSLPKALEPMRQSRTQSQVQPDSSPVLIREEETPTKRGVAERRGSRLTDEEPRVPEPVDEAKQRFSTPRRQSHSPQSTLSEQKRLSPAVAYPVAVSKNKVFRGPVLKSQYDKLTLENGKLRAAGAFRKRKRTAQDRPREDVGDSLEEASAILAPKFNPKPEARPAAAEKRKPSLGSDAQDASVCLPKRRIKPGRSQLGEFKVAGQSDPSKSRERKSKPPR